MRKLISQFDVQLHIKVINSQSFRWSNLLKFDIQVEDTYIYEFLKKNRAKSQSQEYVISASM